MKIKFYLYFIAVSVLLVFVMGFLNVQFKIKQRSRVTYTYVIPSTQMKIGPFFDKSATKVRKTVAATTDESMLELQKRNIGGGSVSNTQGEQIISGAYSSSGSVVRSNEMSGVSSGGGTVFYASKGNKGGNTISAGGGGASSVLTTQNSIATTPYSAPRAADKAIIIDPGPDPTGPPIPVGNGIYFLLILGITYVLIRQKTILNF